MVQRPPAVRPTDEVTTLCKVFGTPLVVKGKTWLLLIELVVWGFMARVAGKRRPQRSWLARLGVGALTMPMIVGFEWGHNFAHAAAARLVRKPMDALRITWGTPLVVYYEIADESVTPRQHIVRALGGPVFNFGVLVVSLLLRRRTHPDSVTRDVADAASGMNLFLCTFSLLPLPGIDGGPILKWSLVERGHTPDEADKIVQKVDSVLGVALTTAGAIALKRHRRWWGLGLLTFGLLSLALGLGIIRE